MIQSRDSVGKQERIDSILASDVYTAKGRNSDLSRVEIGRLTYA